MSGEPVEFYGGSIRVYRDGKIEKIKKGSDTYEETTPKLDKVGRSDGSRYEYRVFFYNRVSGRYKTVYVKKLLADAFIPKEDHHASIGYINGNHEDCSLENLVRITKKELKEKITQGRLKACPGCNTVTFLHKGQCTTCNQQQIKENIQYRKRQISLRKKQLKTQEVQKKLECINIKDIHKRSADIVSMRREGFLIKEIAEKHNLTPDRINQILKEILDMYA